MNYIERMKELQKQMLADNEFQDLCLKHGLPWDPANGYEPRWFAGHSEKPPRYLVVMAEPAMPAPYPDSSEFPPSIDRMNWLDGYDLSLREHYWRENVEVVFKQIWPNNTSQMMNKHVGGTCAFWMSLPPGKANDDVPRELESFFMRKYFPEILKICGDVELIAAGGKAQRRLSPYNIPHHSCWAFTRPGCNRKEARESWVTLGKRLARSF